jgi:hypothetical protein
MLRMMRTAKEMITYERYVVLSPGWGGCYIGQTISVHE